MKKVLVMLLEYGFIIAAMVALVASWTSSGRGIDLQRQPLLRSQACPERSRGKKISGSPRKATGLSLHDGRQAQRQANIISGTETLDMEKNNHGQAPTGIFHSILS